MLHVSIRIAKRLKVRSARERDIAKSLEMYDAEVHSRGETDHRVYRVKTLMSFLRAGVPLNKILHFQPILEEHAYSLGGRRALSDVITFVLQNEREQLKQEIEGRDISIVFDGTTRMGEAMAVVLRFVDSEWRIQQRLARLLLLAKSMTGEEVAHELIVVLSTSLAITPNRLVAAMRDRAAVNGAAMRTLKVLYLKVLDVGCFSHTTDNAGRHFSTRILDDFMQSWLIFFPTAQKHAYCGKLVLGVACRAIAAKGGGANGKLWNSL